MTLAASLSDVELQRARWRRARAALRLLDPEAEDFATGGLERFIEQQSVRLLILPAYSGCRPGELLALTWSDVAWDAGGVTIRRNLSSVRGAVPVLLPPKTAKGRRVVSVAPEAIEALRKHRLRQDAMRVRLGDDYHDDDLIFATHTGTPLDHHNVVRAFKELVRRAGLPATTRLYDLRHAHATALFAAGVHPKAASERLGHAAISLTLDTYTHAIAGLDAEAGIKVRRLFQAQRSGRTGDEEKS